MKGGIDRGIEEGVEGGIKGRIEEEKEGEREEGREGGRETGRREAGRQGEREQLEGDFMQRQQYIQYITFSPTLSSQQLCTPPVYPTEPVPHSQ